MVYFLQVFFFKKSHLACLLIYLFLRDRDRQRSSFCWFTPQMLTIAGLGLGRSEEKGTLGLLHPRWQESNYLGLPRMHVSRKLDSEADLGLEPRPASVWSGHPRWHRECYIMFPPCTYFFERQGDRNRQSSHLLVHFPNVCRGWGWPRLKPGAWSLELSSRLPCAWQGPSHLSHYLLGCALAGSWH